HSAETYNPGALSIVGYVILSCRTAGEALDRLTRYAPLLNDGLLVELVERHGNTACRFSAVDHVDSYLRRDSRQVMETLAAGTVGPLKRLPTGPLQPTMVTFRPLAPTMPAEHRRILGPNVVFGHTEDAVVYSNATLETPLISADPALLSVFEGDARRR